MKRALFWCLFFSTLAQSAESLQELESYKAFRAELSKHCSEKTWKGLYSVKGTLLTVPLTGQAELYFRCPQALRALVKTALISSEFISNSNEAWVFVPELKNAVVAEHYLSPGERLPALLMELFKKPPLKMPEFREIAKETAANFTWNFEKNSQYKVFGLKSKNKKFYNVELNYPAEKPAELWRAYLPTRLHFEDLQQGASLEMQILSGEEVLKPSNRLFVPDTSAIKNMKEFTK